MSFTGILGTADSQLGNFELAESNTIPVQTASNTLTFSQTAAYQTNDLIDVQQTFIMSQLARGFNGTKQVLQTLPLSQLAEASKVYDRSGADTITFSHLSEVEQLRITSDTITFVDSTDVDKFLGTNDTITFTQDLVHQYNPHIEQLFQTLTLTQTVLAPRVLTLPVTQTFTINQAATGYRVRTASASSFFDVHDDAVAVQILLPADTITFSQTLEEYRIISKTLTNTLTLNHAVVVLAVFNRSLSDTLVFKHVHDKLIPNGQIITVPDVVVTQTSNVVTFQVPQQTIAFKKPLLQDTEGGLSEIVKQYSVNGQLYTYARRVANRKLKYTFEISRAKAEETRSYIINYLSQPMKMQNWKGEIWWGVITNNPFPIKSTKRSVPCNNEDFEISIEFEGVRIH